MEKNLLVLLIIIRNTLDAKITQKKLKCNQSDFDEKIKRLVTKEEIWKNARVKSRSSIFN